MIKPTTVHGGGSPEHDRPQPEEAGGLRSASRFQGPSVRSWHLLHPSLAEHCFAERLDRGYHPRAIRQCWTPGLSPLSVIVENNDDDGLFAASWCTRLGGGWLEGILCLLSEPQRAPSSKMYLLWTVVHLAPGRDAVHPLTAHAISEASS
ncbi:unnamed protein product [Rangifer tarandus platyrhynchus]|uniref:Uncharacterized protein n=1 Tax=Rangifer tarandus platyrhynchus TaxID=3082113 RepID=A0ABN8ZMA0_RANTA|nr:unnamed protein product [Rangifer tarandus platyrhynchus]